MPVQDITRILRNFEADGGERLADRYGEHARTIAAEMAALVEVRLVDDTPYAGLWEAFQADADGTEPELTGACWRRRSRLIPV